MAFLLALDSAAQTFNHGRVPRQAKTAFYDGANDIQREFNDNSTRFIVIQRGGCLGQVREGAGVPTASQRSLDRASVAELGPGAYHVELR